MFPWGRASQPRQRLKGSLWALRLAGCLIGLGLGQADLALFPEPDLRAFVRARDRQGIAGRADDRPVPAPRRPRDVVVPVPGGR